MNEWAIFLPMLIMGLISSGHCIGMCGGIMGALTMAIPTQVKHKRWLIIVAYNLGRIASYTLMGFLVGLLAQQLINIGGASVLRIVAGLLLIAMGLYLANWWRGLTYLEAVGRYVWVYLQPLGKPLLPVNSSIKALLLGGLWGWLPCGLVYSALALAMTQTASLAAGSMLAFGLGTLPAVVAAGFAAHQLTRFLQMRNVRIGLSLLIILYGLLTISGGLGGHEHHHSHMQQPADSSSQQEQKPEPDHSMMHHHNM